ncbi:ribosomal protein S18-alanine N-acetyltransferase [Desemzia sp. RIT804]|uniref:ribosomal protein S18-alanine N-acetyltransferase n=1 Tax=Desemzia sp. RIT 804 TaxID=2810209 RepID=UPI00194ECCE6|nr:ribosomal protein S18-alanine N-acetyltransferase [Desemzia sp. RIT 804]MBM6615547.1 ribosomal protein S18-alanine N-acetyltransferase [Desemzia sp. RIT 804]
MFELANKNYSTGSPWSVLGFEEDLKTAQAHYGIVLFNNRCIGFIGYHSILGEAEITNFVIAKQFQRQGTALKLLQRCLEKLNTENVEQVFLEVRESNQNAIQLYQKCGFQKIGIRKNYYTQPIENALIMQLAFKAKNEKE